MCAVSVLRQDNQFRQFQIIWRVNSDGEEACLENIAYALRIPFNPDALRLLIRRVNHGGL